MFTYMRGMDRDSFNCVEPAIDEFPPDGWTKEERAQGWVAVHFVAACYIFIALAIICDEYFVPCVERLCIALDMSTDIAGATFMAAATSAPELSVNIIGTFITEGDLGIGTIVGSAVFNTLGVAATACIVSGVTIKLDWWPLSRDCGIYGVSILALIWVLWDSIVKWYEAAVLVASYLVYILLMYYDKVLMRKAKASPTCQKIPCFDMTMPDNVKRDSTNSKADDDDYELNGPHLCSFPSGEGICTILCFIIQYPLYLMYYVTIPDVRNPRLKNWYALSFIMCCVWIGVWSYLVAWAITTVGDTFHIPDSVMGITFLAIGTSIPEAVSSVVVAKRGDTYGIPDSVMGVTFLSIGTSLPEAISSVLVARRGDTLEVPDSIMGITFLAVGTSIPEAIASIIVAKKGYGTMAIGNAIGSNTFDILICLGIPWLFKTAFFPQSAGDHELFVNSSGLLYCSLSLMCSVAMFYMVFACTKFTFQKSAGYIFAVIYLIYIVFASLVELNVFFEVNYPTCEH